MKRHGIDLEQPSDEQHPTNEAPHWQLYTRPITLETSATIRARAVRYGWSESEEVAENFAVVPR